MHVPYADKKSKKHSGHKSKKGKEKGVDEIDIGKTVIPNKAAVEADDGEQQSQAKQAYELGQSQPVSEKKTDSQPRVKPVPVHPPGRPQPTIENKVNSQPQTKPVFPLGQPHEPIVDKKADSQNLPQTPTTTSIEKQQPPAPQKKVYPKEKHPRQIKAEDSPKFGQRLLAAPPPGKAQSSVKPEPLLKPSEQKRFEAKPSEVAKPSQKVFSPHRKAPEPPAVRASPKPTAKVTTRAIILQYIANSYHEIHSYQCACPS